MWKDAPEALKARVGEALERPVFFSVADESEGMVFGADGAVVVSGDRTQKVDYRDLAGVRCSEVGIEAPQGKEFALNLNVRSQGTIRVRVEGGAAGYGVWRVLQMVMRMREAWFAPKPEPEAEPETESDAPQDASPEQPSEEVETIEDVPESDVAEAEAPEAAETGERTEGADVVSEEQADEGVAAESDTDADDPQG